jgi:hypothetical protein
MKLRLRSSRQKKISLEIGRGFVVCSAPMTLRIGLAALAVFALSLPGLRASAQDEFSDEKPPEKQKAPAPAPEESEAPAEPPAKSTKPAPEPEPAVGPYVPLAPAPDPLRISNSVVSIQFGMLLQPQFEMVGDAAATLTAKNLFLRRTRLIIGGTLYKYFEFFFDTDYPDLFKQDGGSTTASSYKNSPGLNIQDAFVTAKPAGDLIGIDAGFMLPPLSHNNIESAAKLYGVDYFANGFRRNVAFINAYDPFHSNVQNPQGRDLGIQLRGLVAFGHVEYRVGVFQGFRVVEVPGPPAKVGALNFFRAAARLQINILDAEPGFFHAGTYHGAKKILSVGGFYDFEDKYKYYGGDLFVDLPAGPGVVTAQATVARWDGGTFIPEIHKNSAYMAEIGYLIGPLMLSPIFRYERVNTPLVANPDPTMTGMVADPQNPSENRIGGGLAFWPYGHNTNFKAFFQRIHRLPGTQDYNQVNVQWQLYFY